MSFDIHLSGHVKSVVEATLPGLVASLVAAACKHPAVDAHRSG